VDNDRIIDAIRKRLHLPSDYALAKLWGVPIPTISSYRHGKKMSAYFTMRAAEALDKDPRELIAERELAGAKNDIVRGYWETLVRKRFGVASAGACTAVCTAIFAAIGLTIPYDAEATSLRTEQHLLVIMSTLGRKAWSAFRRLISVMCPTTTPPLALDGPLRGLRCL
jgi:hypothetical protein